MTIENDVALSSRELSARELEIVKLVANGMTNRQVATDLGLSPATVKTHLQRIALKVGDGSRSAIVAYCMRRGLIS